MNKSSQRNKTGKILFLTHFLYVDDVLLFGDGTWRYANKIKEIP
jgi:hypothetical protein